MPKSFSVKVTTVDAELEFSIDVSVIVCLRDLYHSSSFYNLFVSIFNPFHRKFMARQLFINFLFDT